MSRDDSSRPLYRAEILDHNRAPRNRRVVDKPTAVGRAANPSCGDSCLVYLCMQADGRVEDCAFSGSGCAVMTASASMMTEAVRGRTRGQAAALAGRFQDFVQGTGDPRRPIDGPLAVFGPASGFPARQACVRLPWQALETALRALPDETKENSHP